MYVFFTKMVLIYFFAILQYFVVNIDTKIKQTKIPLVQLASNHRLFR